MKGFTTLSFAALIAGGAAQFVTPPNSSVFTTVNGPLGIKIRYKEVTTGPGSICEQNANVKSYSGFVDISAHEHYFFWFFGARNVDPQDAHLTAWISGGPGSSSMSELMTEHGPCRIDQNLKPTNNPYSWNTNSNVVYIDQPTTVGFSYTDAVPAYIQKGSCAIKQLPNNTCPHFAQHNQSCGYYGNGACGTFPKPDPAYSVNSTETAAVKFWYALQGIYAAFPQYTKQGFTLGSESYGGHYAPVFSRYIAQQNSKLPNGAVHIPQQSVQVNNGWFDPAVSYAAFYSYLVDSGNGRPGNTFDLSLSAAAGKKMKDHLYGSNQCLDGLAKCNSPNGTDKICRHWDDYCTEHVQAHLSRNLHRDLYNVRELRPNPFPNGYYIYYLNTERVQKELAVFTNYSDYSVLVGDLFEKTGDDAKELGIVHGLADLLDSGVSVTIMAGDADYDCNWLGGRIIAEKIANLSTTTGLTSAYAAAGYQNLSTFDHVVHGAVRQAGRLSFVRVYEAGHQVGFYQPLAEQAIYNRTIAGMDIATGLTNVTTGSGTSLYRSHGPQNSTYFEGNATVQFKVTPGKAAYNYTSNEPTLNQGPGTSSNIS